MLAYLEAKIATKSNLLVSIFQIFLGGIPTDSLEGMLYSQVITLELGTPNSKYLPPPMYEHILYHN